jgi:glycosyltransferase involved in cell wall biosynthesis
LKVSLITVVYNAANTLPRCIDSVISQNHPDIEYIIIDGGSTDGTLQIVDQYRDFVSVIISEPDKGIYDAMNKGITRATGDIVGTLNADDTLADNDVLAAVARSFELKKADVVYGNLNVIGSQGNIIRRWISKQCVRNSFNWGFMPPHPTFYCKRELFGEFGFYSLEFGSAADYELMLRFMYKHRVNGCFLNKVLVNMLAGGVSNSSLKNRVKAWNFDLKAMRHNHIKIPALTVVLKPLRKLHQFLKLKA